MLKFSLYLSFFPQLIAGPIVKYRDVELQIDNRETTLIKFGEGSSRFILGLGKKVILANALGSLYTEISSLPHGQVSVVLYWIGIAAYTLQIYFDFSGYSDMAIGLGKMFGFVFDENFNYPYIASTITDFWRRWHMSLSTWFREYVYIPLGGNRVKVHRHILNLLIVWSLTGLWHGASWNFVLWGAYFGVLLILEKYVYGKYLEKAPNWFRHAYAIVIVMGELGFLQHHRYQQGAFVSRCHVWTRQGVVHKCYSALLHKNEFHHPSCWCLRGNTISN